AESRDSAGYFDVLNGVASRSVLAAGWAVAPGLAPADAVLLSYETRPGRYKIFAVAATGARRSDVAEAFDERFLFSGWEKQFSTDVLPLGRSKIVAWAYNVDAASALKLKG